MRKTLFSVLLGAALLTGTDAEAKRVKGGPDLGASASLSMMFPGAGEWYNSDFNYGFPLWECIVGYICPCVRFASVFDAAYGRKAKKVRANFWVAP